MTRSRRKEIASQQPIILSDSEDDCRSESLTIISDTFQRQNITPPEAKEKRAGKRKAPSNSLAKMSLDKKPRRISTYEKERMENIRRKEEMLAKLNLLEVKMNSTILVTAF